MALKVSSRGQIPPFIVMDVMRAAADREAAGHDVMHLEVGQPGTGAPAGVIAAVKDALDRDRLGYTLAFGTQELRDRIARHYREFYGVEVPVERIVATTGSSGGFILSFLAAFDAGDRVALASPGYPAHGSPAPSRWARSTAKPSARSGHSPTLSVRSSTVKRHAIRCRSTGPSTG